MADRRSAGEGSIYKLPNGRWQGAVDLGWVNGKRQRRRITRATRRAVVAELRELVQQAEQGQLSPAKPPTLAAWLDIYLAEVAATRVRPSTLASYESHIKRQIAPALAQHRIDRLRPQHISTFYRDLSGSLSASPVRRIHAILRRALTVAVRWGLISANPATMVDPPPMTKSQITPYTVEEARAFLAAVERDRLKARWVVGLSLGMRQGEVLGLQWCDVDFDRDHLRVRRALRRQPGGALTLVATKTASSERTIPMPTPVAEALRGHRKRQLEQRMKLGDAWHESDFVFTTAIGTPINPRNDYRSFQLIIKKSGLRKVRLHDLRHTAASLLLAQGVPARVVMEILGHSQISVTMNTYSQVDTTLTRVAADRMQEALWPSEK